MSVLDDVLKEEYNRSKKIIKLIEDELNSLPKGYISKKKINGKVYYYLQKRQDGKIISKYISRDNIDNYQRLLNRRKELEEALKERKEDKKKLERVLK